MLFGIVRSCWWPFLMLLRIEQRLTRERATDEANLLEVLSEALAIDPQRFTECAFWMAFWGQVSADKELKKLNAWVHREYMRLFARCFGEYWSDWPAWPQAASALAPPGPITIAMASSTFMFRAMSTSIWIICPPSAATKRLAASRESLSSAAPGA